MWHGRRFQAAGPAACFLAIQTRLRYVANKTVRTSKIKQGVALTGRNRTVPPRSVGRRNGNAPGPAAADRPRALQTTPTDDSVQNNTGPLGGPVITAAMN